MVIRVEVEVDFDRGDVRVVGDFMVVIDVFGVFVVGRIGCVILFEVVVV